jgi:hypothetical protein
VDEELEKMEEQNMLYENGRVFKINNMPRKYFKALGSWCKAEEGIMSCKLRMLTGWVN